MIFCRVKLVKVRQEISAVTYGARVNCHAIILVVDRGVFDSNRVGRSDIEGISILSQGITGRSVDGNVGQFQIGSTIDGEDLYGRIENRQSLN